MVVNDITERTIQGFLIASTHDFYWGKSIRKLSIKNITEYKILTVKDLPLLIGYKYKSQLLDELLKEGDKCLRDLVTLKKEV